VFSLVSLVLSVSTRKSKKILEPLRVELRQIPAQLRERQGGLGSYQGGFVLRTHSFGFYFYFLVVVVVVVVGN
jgi:hypothetical protein